MKHEILIVGAGPVGLSAALFLRNSGRTVRIVDKLLAPIQESKALAVNPRTLELLESSGVTDLMLERGLKMRSARLWHEDGSPVGELKLNHLNSRYPYMLALSQATSEQLLTEALGNRGVKIERGREVTSVDVGDDQVVTHFSDGSQISSQYLFAADGAHSRIREDLRVPFEGSSFPGEWHLVDAPFRTDLSPDSAHLVFQHDGGFFFFMRVITDIRRPVDGNPIWRLMSTRPDPVANFRLGTATADPVWASHFKVSHRISQKLEAGRVFFAGDAAHLHSPAGARGMNLGIEDAWVFSQLLNEGRLENYGPMRREIDRSVVRKVDLLTRFAIGDQAYIRALREFFLPAAIASGAFQDVATRTIAGLDHNVSQERH